MTNRRDPSASETVRQAFGSRGHFAEAFRALLSSSESERRRGYWLVDNHAVVQGDIYAVAADVAWVVVHLLQNPNVTDGRKELYSLLVEFLSGYAPDDLVAEVDGVSGPVMQHIRRAALSAAVSIVADLENESVEVRRGAADVANELGKAMSPYAAAIRLRLADETDPAVVSSLRELADELDGCPR